MRNLILVSLFFVFASQPLMAKEVGPDFPKMTDFAGSDLEVYTADWEAKRKPDTGGANVGIDKVVPADRVVVDWRAVESSCIRCEPGRDERVYYEGSGPLNLPRGVHVGVRFKAGCPTCQGASYTGDITCIHVSRDRWVAVFLEKYASVEKTVANPHSEKPIDQLLKELGAAEADLKMLRKALIEKLPRTKNDVEPKRELKKII